MSFLTTTKKKKGGNNGLLLRGVYDVRKSGIYDIRVFKGNLILKRGEYLLIKCELDNGAQCLLI